MIDRITTAFAALWTSVVRTGVPMIVGAIVGWLVTLGFPVDDDLKAAITGFITVIFALLYYILIRLLERIVPKLGWLLGSPKQPVYALPAAVTTVEATAQIANEIARK